MIHRYASNVLHNTWPFVSSLFCRGSGGLAMWSLLAFSVTLFGGAPAPAQDSLPAFGDSAVQEPGTNAMNFDDWRVECLLLVIGLIVATVIVFSLFYQFLLERWVWPLDAYGRSLALVSTLAFAWAAFLFWEDLLNLIPGPNEFFERHGGRLVLGIAWLLTCSIILLLFRSDRGQSAAT